MTEVCSHRKCLGSRESRRDLFIRKRVGRPCLSVIPCNIRRCNAATCLGIGITIGVCQFIRQQVIAFFIQSNGNIAAAQCYFRLGITIAIIKLSSINITNAR